MKIAVFCATSFIGQNIVEKLKSEGEDFISTDFVDSPSEEEIDYRRVDILRFLGRAVRYRSSKPRTPQIGAKGAIGHCKIRIEFEIF